jgi:hypothetical protein
MNRVIAPKSSSKYRVRKRVYRQGSRLLPKTKSVLLTGLDAKIDELKTYITYQGFEFDEAQFDHLATNTLRPTDEEVSETLIESLVQDDNARLP